MTFFIIFALITLFNLTGGLVAYVYLPKIKASSRAWEFFSAYLMIILALDLVIVRIIDNKIEEFSLPAIFSGFMVGFFVVMALMILFHLLTKQHGANHMQNHGALGIVLFLLLGVHEVSEGFGIAEIFFEGSANIPLKLTLAPAVVLGLHEFPEGILLVLPFFLSKKIRSGLYVLLTNQFIFIISGLLVYFYFLQIYEPNIGEKAFFGTLPSGGIFFLGLHDLISAIKNPQRIRTFTKVTLLVVSIGIFMAVTVSLIFTNARVDKIKSGETYYKCAREFTLENCME